MTPSREPGDTLRSYISRHLGETVTTVARRIGRDRSTLQHWWKYEDPILPVVVAGLKQQKGK